MKILILIFAMFLSINLGAQILPDVPQPEIEVLPVTLSIGTRDGFIFSLPGADTEFTRKEWIDFTYTLFPRMGLEDEEPRIPVTVEQDGDDNEFTTTGLYIPSLSQNTMTFYFRIENQLSTPDDTLLVMPTTRFSLIVDYGNRNFLNVDSFNQVDVVKHLLYRFYFTLEKHVASRQKK